MLVAAMTASVLFHQFPVILVYLYEMVEWFCLTDLKSYEFCRVILPSLLEKVPMLLIELICPQLLKLLNISFALK
jgi:hypothetical protein